MWKYRRVHRRRAMLLRNGRRRKRTCQPHADGSWSATGKTLAWTKKGAEKNHGASKEIGIKSLEQIIIQHLRLALEKLILFSDEPALLLNQPSLLIYEALLVLD